MTITAKSQLIHLPLNSWQAIQIEISLGYDFAADNVSKKDNYAQRRVHNVVLLTPKLVPLVTTFIQRSCFESTVWNLHQTTLLVRLAASKNRSNFVMIRARPVCYFENKPGIPSDLKEMVNGLYLFSIQFKLLVFFYSKPHSHTHSHKCFFFA